MKKLLVTHTDLDGVGILVLANYFHVELDFILTLNYGDFEFTEEGKNPFVDIFLEYDIIYFTDISPTEKIYNMLIERGKEVWIYDHHESAIWIKEKDNTFYDDTSCGTKIFFEKFIVPKYKRFKPIVKEFVKYVNTYDLWQKESPLWEEAKNFHRVLFGSYNWAIKETCDWRKYYSFIKNTVTKLDKAKNWFWLSKEKSMIERAVSKEKQVYAAMLRDGQTRKDRNGKSFFVSQASSKISFSCSQYLEENPDIDYIIICNSWNDLNGDVHARTAKENLNLSEYLPIVKGHPKASGGNIGEHAHDFLKGEIKDFFELEKIIEKE